MLPGFMLVIAGVLIAIYPPLLSIIVAVFLIMTGAMLLSIGYYHRKMQKHFDNPAVEAFFRY